MYSNECKITPFYVLLTFWADKVNESRLNWGDVAQWNKSQSNCQL